MSVAPYSDYLYHGTAHWDPRFAEYLVDTLSGLSGVSSICELGCGNGALAHLLAARGYEVTGIDASASGIEQARKAENGATFVCDAIDGGMARRLGLSQPFDAVFSSEVIEHLYRPAVMLEAADSLLRPGGWLVLTTPYHGYFKYLALALAGRMDRHLEPNWEGGHIKFFSPNTLSSLVSSHGYHGLSFRYYGRFFALWKSMILVARASG